MMVLKDAVSDGGLVWMIGLERVCDLDFDGAHAGPLINDCDAGGMHPI